MIPKKLCMYPVSLSIYSRFWGMYPPYLVCVSENRAPGSPNCEHQNNCSPRPACVRTVMKIILTSLAENCEAANIFIVSESKSACNCVRSSLKTISTNICSARAGCHSLAPQGISLKPPQILPHPRQRPFGQVFSRERLAKSSC